MIIRHLTEMDRRHVEWAIRTGPIGPWEAADEGIQGKSFAPIIGTDLTVVIARDLPAHEPPGVNAGISTNIVKNDVGAYVLDRAIGLRMVPPTQRREIDMAGRAYNSSLMLHVEANDPGRLADVTPEEVRRAAAFDIAVRCNDRHNGNWLSQPCDACGVSHIVLIDNSWGFGWKHPRGIPTIIHRHLVETAADHYGGPDLGVLERIADDPAVAAALAESVGELTADGVVSRARRYLVS